MTILFVGCSGKKEASRHYDLQGFWPVVSLQHPDGKITHYPANGGYTNMYVYDNDSILYYCELRYLKDAIDIVPMEKRSYYASYKGNGEFMYVEDGHARPLRFTNDTTIVLQKYGHKITMVRGNGLIETNRQKILDVLRSDFTNTTHQTRFVLSKTENDLRETTHTLAYILLIAAVAIAVGIAYVIRIHRRNKRLRQQLQEIEEERKFRPEKVDKVMKEVEEDFFMSEYYLGIRQRIADGERLGNDDWREMVTQLRRVYPSFYSRLIELIQLSDVELKVCLLIKLRIAAKDIAAVLYRSPSGISSIRTRLYQKVFGKKGSVADWDEFIWTL